MSLLLKPLYRQGLTPIVGVRKFYSLSGDSSAGAADKL